MISVPHESSDYSVLDSSRSRIGLWASRLSPMRAFAWSKRLAGILCAIFAFPAVALLGGLLVFAANVYGTATRPLVPAEGLVVLTGGTGRVANGLDLIALGAADRALITGVHEQTSSRHLTRLSGLPKSLFACCVDLGYSARNTMGNARETLAWVRARGIRRALIVVTSNYHMPRAMLEFRTALPGYRLIPAAVISEEQKRNGFWMNPAMLRHVTLEYFKFLATYARGWALPAHPLPRTGRSADATALPFRSQV